MTAAPFSVLLPAYGGDDPTLLSRALDSVTADQTRPPDEAVVVCDGPLPSALETTIAGFARHSPVPVSIVRLASNVGLGRALDEGLARCRHEIVARMDADDVSVPERFARQVPLLEGGLEVLGSAVAEIGHDEADVRGIRRPPSTEDEIRRFARFHSPFNHPTVVFKRSAVTRVGGYGYLGGNFEDYWLWVRVLADGARVGNLPEPLVLYRVGTGAYDRRGGRGMVGPEIELQRRMRRLGFTSRRQFVRNVVVRAGWRLVPVGVRRILYRLVFHRAGSASGGDGRVDR